jgi:hypothetical protein
MSANSDVHSSSSDDSQSDLINRIITVTLSGLRIVSIACLVSAEAILFSLAVIASRDSELLCSVDKLLNGI